MNNRMRLAASMLLATLGLTARASHDGRLDDAEDGLRDDDPGTGGCLRAGRAPSASGKPLATSRAVRPTSG